MWFKKLPHKLDYSLWPDLSLLECSWSTSPALSSRTQMCVYPRDMCSKQVEVYICPEEWRRFFNIL